MGYLLDDLCKPGIVNAGLKRDGTVHFNLNLVHLVLDFSKNQTDDRLEAVNLVLARRLIGRLWTLKLGNFKILCVFSWTSNDLQDSS